jgi:Cd2+/Zn2+-exporting ATPase
MSPQAREVLSAAAAAEQYSTHPIAEAIVDAARARGVDVPEAHESRAVPGFGVTATLRGETVKVGQRRFFEQEGTELPPDFIVHVEGMQAKGMTVAVMEFRGRYAALGLRDEPRPEVRSVLDELSGLGVRRQLIVTGDTDQTANAVAAEVGIAEVYAGLLPDQKTELIDRMMAEGRHVMMVGDGINDAPSLARADIGVAMGGLGSDVTLNAADVVLMQDRLERIPDLVRLGRRTNAIVRANLLFATGVIVFLTAGSQLLDLFAPQWTYLALPFAVVGHEGSTVLVILNGLRLLRGPGNGR